MSFIAFPVAIIDGPISIHHPTFTMPLATTPLTIVQLMILIQDLQIRVIRHFEQIRAVGTEVALDDVSSPEPALAKETPNQTHPTQIRKRAHV